MDLAEAVAALLAQLDAGQVRAAADLRDVNPPCVLVRPPRMSWRFGKDCWDATWEMWAVVPDTGAADALSALSLLIGQVQVALGGRVVEGRPVDVQAIDGAGTLPGYALTYTQRIT